MLGSEVLAALLVWARDPLHIDAGLQPRRVIWLLVQVITSLQGLSIERLQARLAQLTEDGDRSRAHLRTAIRPSLLAGRRLVALGAFAVGGTLGRQ